MPHAPRLEEQLCGAIRLKHFSLRTEESDVGWVTGRAWAKRTSAAPPICRAGTCQTPWRTASQGRPISQPWES